MFQVRSHLASSLLFVGLLIFIGAKVGSQINAEEKTRSADETRLQQLFKDRYTARKEIVDIYSTLAGKRAVATVESASARVKMLIAELDLRDNKAERVAIHEKIVGVKKEIEDMMKQVSPKSIEAIVSRADRIEAEIALERERLK